MDSPNDLETKYKKIATEYSKMRSQATVLKKALLDEQAKSTEVRNLLKEYEQRIRKSDQEMESLVFRNDQLTKRISVLQQELQQSTNKKLRNKSTDCSPTVDITAHNEELHKKILENAELVIAVNDKENELSIEKEKAVWLEMQIAKLQTSVEDMDRRHKKELDDAKLTINEEIVSLSSDGQGDFSATDNKWQKEAERWRLEYELLKSKPESNDEELSAYYESKMRNVLIERQQAQSEVSSLWAESLAVSAHLEHSMQQKQALEQKLEKCDEELSTINDNYQTQLDAMTEHLASLNDTITRQSDLIQDLQHQLSFRK